MKRPLIALLLLAGCIAPTPPAQNPSQSTCTAPQLQGLVGEPASVLQTMRFGPVTRILRPGTAITMDFSASRLNIAIGRDEVISRVYCG